MSPPIVLILDTGNVSAAVPSDIAEPCQLGLLNTPTAPLQRGKDLLTPAPNGATYWL